ncbi:LOB domain-containing protein 24-like [Cynara cardunculus var. scolymus]|uniref:LOB domain-containing protein 24-like n=1 Tax=Cynara cardunculus var. scolymus TaxID=59895 RepID=UPI000D62CD8F|nr:LOB domain-containing protein 24-like [Cynara cardunculus var. scolymus]
MSSTRCAVCKYFRRRCPSDCVFAPCFPPDNPQRFTCVHRIYGASNIGKMLEELPMHLRVDAVDSLYYEAKWRIQEPVYGCVGIISSLHRQIHIAQTQLAKARAETAFLRANVVAAKTMPSSGEFMAQQNSIDNGLDDQSNPWFY